MPPAVRSRRSCLSVPGSSPRMLAKAPGLPADEVLLDLEDSVAPAAKPQARLDVVAALREAAWDGRIVSVRINDWSTPWTATDVMEVVGAAGDRIDCLILPKADRPEHVAALDLLLTQVERTSGLEPGRIGLEAQIENAVGLTNVDAVAQASPRLEALVFGPLDFVASIGMKPPTGAGGQPVGYDVGDAYHYPLFRILTAARANGLQAIDGPFARITDLDGFRTAAQRSAALGFDGKWVIHPSQLEAANEIYRPAQEDYDRAEVLLEVYQRSVTGPDAAGAVRLDDEMIDEASRKLALTIADKGRAAGMRRTTT